MKLVTYRDVNGSQDRAGVSSESAGALIDLEVSGLGALRNRWVGP